MHWQDPWSLPFNSSFLDHIVVRIPLGNSSFRLTQGISVDVPSFCLGEIELAVRVLLNWLLCLSPAPSFLLFPIFLSVVEIIYKQTQFCKHFYHLPLPLHGSCLHLTLWYPFFYYLAYWFILTSSVYYFPFRLTSVAACLLPQQAQ